MRIHDVMTTDLTTVPTSMNLRDVARCMRDDDIGDVLVVHDDGRLAGILTDRDIVVRALADGGDPAGTMAGDVCSAAVVAAAPDDSVADAERLMREHAIRRVPVVDGGRPVGMLSIGDLAIDLDAESALAAISAAPANT